MEVNKTIELKTTAKAIEFSANKPTSVSSEFLTNTLTVNYFEQGKKKSAEIVLESSTLVSFIFNPTTNNFDLGTDEPESDYSYIPIGYAYVSDGAITKFIPFGAVDYSSEIDEEKTARESADELLQANKVDKETGKGLSTNDFTTAEKTKLYSIEEGAEANVQSDWSQSDSSADDYIKNKPANLVQDSSYVHTDNNFNNDYKSKIETNEYNDVFNIRVEWDRSYMPDAELLVINFQRYSNGILVNDMIEDDVQNITNGNVYLYKDTSDLWAMAVGTAPSSYNRTPMLIGRIATKTVNGATVKLFFRNGDDETQFDKLNSEKVDKEGNWELISTARSEGDVSVFQGNEDSNGNPLNLKAILIVGEIKGVQSSNTSLYCYAYSDDDYSSVIKLETVSSVVRTNWTQFIYKVSIENGIWFKSFSCKYNNSASHIDRLDKDVVLKKEENRPTIKSWKVQVPSNTFGVASDVSIYGIRGE